MEFYKRVVLVAVVMAVGAYGSPQRNSNEYLPPDQGYSYPKPSVPFNTQTPSPPQPRPPTTSYRPPPPPPPAYKPPQQTPYQPPPPPYQPPQQPYSPPPPAYKPAPPPPPAYKPPQQTPYQPPPPAYKPPTPTYGPPPPAYKPPQQTPYQPPPPAYKPPTPTYGPPPPTQPPYQPPRPQTPRPQQDLGGDGSHDHSNSHHGADHVHEAGMPYDFNYAVKDDQYGTDFSQNEVSDGDQVKGEYRVQLPDGRLQIVRYTADWKTGFHADVTYEGEARYPEPAPYKPQPNLRPAASNQQDSGYNYPAPTQANPATQYGAPNTGY